jgi:hypothetical protein
MAEATPEKSAPAQNINTPPHSVDEGDPEIPSGWMYRKRKIGPITIPWYAGPESQLILVAFVCFMCPGK